MKRLLLLMMLAVAFGAEADAQGWLKKLGQKAQNAAKHAVERKVEDKVERETDDAMDAVLDGTKSKNSSDADAGSADVGEQEEADAQTTTSSDFKRGEVILFQDDFSGETVGEFPSKWDLLDGSAEVKTHGGVKAVEITNNGVITPLIKEQGAYLPEEFTIEYEFYYWVKKENVGLNNLKLCLANNTDRSKWAGYYGSTCAFSLEHGVVDEYSHHYNYNNGTGTNTKQTDFEYRFKKGWNKVALSFNKRAMKVYFNGKRVINLPRVQQPTWVSFQVPYDYHDLTFIRNVVIAKGAVALYDRNEQSMSAVEKAIQETGKFVTSNILFETAKATLKAESMAEIQKVAE